ncbi:hypothetical protein, partial [Stenotrophomonas maltophilia]
GVEEATYWISDHWDKTVPGGYRSFILEATSSRLLEVVREEVFVAAPHGHKTRQFAFPGLDLCFETLGYSE